MDPFTLFLGTVTGIFTTAFIETGKWALKESELNRTIEKAFYAPFDRIQESYPDQAEKLFAEPFLSRTDVQDELLLLFTTPHKSPSTKALKKLLLETYPTLADDKNIDALLEDFIKQMEEAMLNEECFHGIVEMRQVNKIEKKTDRILEYLADAQTPHENGRNDIPPDDESTFLGKINDKAEELLTWPKTMKDEGWLERPEYNRLLEWALSQSKKQSRPIFLTGAPGSGKSALLAKLGAELTTQGILLLALKADLLPKTVNSLETLDQHFDLPFPLVEHCKRVSKNKPVIILLDQLDALGGLLTSDPGTLGVMTDLIRSLRGQQEIKIICSCRTFEYNHDPRFSRLDADEIKLTPLTWAQVETVLKRNSISTKDWHDDPKELLKLPQHLNVFLTYLNGDLEQKTASYRNMLRKAWSNSIASAKGLKCGLATSEIAKYMGEQETLWIQDIRFEDRYYHEIDHLVKEEILLRRDEWKIGFRHQTIFDFARARAFLNQQSSLASHIQRHQASLFIRPLLISTLEFLRDLDKDSYHEALRDIWTYPSLKLHIKTLLMEFLGTQTTPDTLEYKLMLTSVNSPKLRSRALRNMSYGSGWFKLLEQDVLPRLMADDEEIADSVRPVLFSAFEHSQEKALSLVDSIWVSNDRFLFESFWMIVNKDSELSLAAIQVLKTIASKEMIRSTFITKAIEQSAQNYPQEAGQLLNTALYYRLNSVVPYVPPVQNKAPEADKNGIEPDFDFLSHQAKIKPWEKLISTHEWHGLNKAILPSPEVFAPVLLKWLSDVLKNILWEPNPRKNAYLEDHSLETSNDPEERPGNYLLKAIRTAIDSLANEKPKQFLELLKANQSSEIMAMHRLLSAGLVQLADRYPGGAFEYLTSDPRRLAIGDTRLATRNSLQLIEAVTPHLSKEQSQQLEDTILEWAIYPELHDDEPDIRLKRIRWNKEHRLALLDAFFPDNLSESSQKMLKEARNAKLPIRRESPPIISGFVSSPMGVEQMEKAKDEEIIGLFAKYDDNTKEHPRKFLVGGSLEASRAFERFAQKAPHRAISIMNHFNPGMQETPMGYGIAGIAESEQISPSELIDHIERAIEKGFTSDSYKQNCLRVLDNLARKHKGLPDSICETIATWITPSTIDHAAREKELDDEDSILWGYGGGYSIPSGNYMTLETLTYGLLCRDTPDYSQWLSILEEHLTIPESEDVIATLLYADLKWLVNANQARAEQYILALEKKYSQAFIGPEGTTFLAYARSWLSNQTLQTLLTKIREGSWAKGAQAFGELVMLHYATSPGNDWISSQIETILSESNTDPQIIDLRKGIAWSASGLWSKDKKYAHTCEQVLTRLAPLAQKQHAKAMLDLFRTDREFYPNKSIESLLRAYSANPAIMERGSRFYFLEKLSDIVNAQPDVVADVAEGVINNLPQFPLPHDAKFHPDLEGLTRLGLALNRMMGYEERGLKLFNKMLELEEHEATQILKDLDNEKKQ